MNQRGRIEDPQSAVHAPYVEALNGIIVRAALGFAAVAAVTTLPLLVHFDDAFHGAMHLALPIGWLAYAAIVAILGRRAGPIAGNPWAKASDAEPGLTRFAVIVVGFMIGGWLAAVVAVLVHHHMSTPVDIARTIALDAPALLVPWAAASWAFVQRCRRSLVRAEERVNDLFRLYWEGIRR